MKTLIVIIVSIVMSLSSFAQVPADAGTITGNHSVCANTTAMYSVGAITNATSYMWTIPAGASITSGYGTNVVIVQFGTTSGDIVVFGQNGNILGNPSSIHVTVNSAPSVTVVANPTDICAGTSTTLTANGGTSFAWSGSIMTTSSITVNPTATTPYTVTVTGSNGCTASGSVTVNVHALPNVTLNFIDDNACTDVNSVLLSGGYPANGTYSCSTPNVVFSGNTIHPPIVGPGTWNITYTVMDMYGCTGSATDLFTVNPIPEVMFNNISGSLNVKSTPVDLNNFVMPQNGDFSGPGTTSGSTIFDPKLAGPGTHTLTYKYVHPITGCSATQIQYITIAQSDSTGTIGINETTSNTSISIYPNPATDQLNLVGIDTKEIVALQIFDLIGKVIYSTDINSESITIDVNNFNSGSYLIRFLDADGVSVTKRFVKSE